MAYRKHKDRVLLQLITVQRNIARLATRNSQLSQFLLCGAADQGMILKDLHSLGDETHRFQRRGCFCLQEKISASAEIGERSRGVDYARQAFALGLDRKSTRLNSS